MQGYCPRHNAIFQGARPPFNWLIFIILFLFTIILGIVYLIYFGLLLEDHCPICESKLILIPTESKEISQNTTELPPNYEPRFCYACGTKLDFKTRFCSHCGNRI